MSKPRILGIGLCLAALIAVYVLALSLSTNRPFAGLPGIESGLATQAAVQLEADGANGAVVIAEGRELDVQLPEVVRSDFDRTTTLRNLQAIEGVRSVELAGDPVFAAVPGSDPDPAPTQVPDPDPTPAAEPTATSAPEPTATRAPEPTALPEPTTQPEATAEPEPTVDPETTGQPDATVEPEPLNLDEVVAGLDLSAVTFEPGTARLTALDTAVLDGIANSLRGLSGGSVEVQAHTNNLGDPDTNFLLTEDRAAAVTSYLIDQGVDASLLTPRGYGASQPIADNSTEQGRAANQRVALVVEGN